MKKPNVKRLVLSAVMLGLALVLSMIKVWTMPIGGSVTLLSMLPIVIISIKYGVKWGMFTSLTYAVMQLLLDLGMVMGWGLTIEIWVGTIIFDYLIAFGILGFAGILRKKGTIGMCVGLGLVLVGRYISHVISGTIFFDTLCPEGWNPFIYAIAYNGSFMLPELIFTMISFIIIAKTSQIKSLITDEQEPV